MEKKELNDRLKLLEDAFDFGIENSKELYEEFKNRKKGIPSKLYKYVSDEIYSIDNLDKNQLTFSNPSIWNDVIDARPNFDIKDDKEKYESSFVDYAKTCIINKNKACFKTKENRELLDKFMEAMKFTIINSLESEDDNLEFKISDEDFSGDEVKVVQALNDFFKQSSSNMDLNKGAKIIKDLYSERDKWYMCCLTESNDIHSMWGHYANYNKGFCIEYELPNVDEVNNNIPLILPIHYSSESTLSLYDYLKVYFGPILDFFSGTFIGSLTNNKKMVKNAETEFNNKNYTINFDGLKKVFTHLYTKDISWSNEKEWRLAIKKQDGESDIRKNIDFPYVKAIYLGYRMEEPYKDLVCKIAKEKGIPVYQQSVEPYSAEYRYEKINLNDKN